MTWTISHRRTGGPATIVVALVALVAASPVRAAEAVETAATCSAPPDLLRLTRPLPRFANRLAERGPIKVVALGSSSTFGLGASSPAATYPARLEAELRADHPGRDIRVVNRGVNGNVTRDEMLRFDHDVIAERPDLVIWQVGTNTLLSGQDMWSVFLDVRAGVRRLNALGADVILMNPQYSPRVLARPNWADMNDLVAVAGRETNVDVFDRFSIMRSWAEQQRYGFDLFIGKDGLHMTDWSYACLAKLLATALRNPGTGRSAGGPMP